MKSFAIAFLFLSLAGCATASKTYTQDGRVGYSVNCSGAINTWAECYTKAGELCGSRGYDILDKSGDEGSMVAGNRNGIYGGSVITRSMQIACKNNP